ncbi:MAG: hypothetical protein IT377_29585 [Polyangiaceae bacterium]|nr:hypothetical protein [Polyangiaceae bacterium]
MKAIEPAVLALAFAAAGCGVVDEDAPVTPDGGDANDWASLSSYADHFPAACGALDALVDFAYANKTCSADGDCVHVGACTEVREHCAGGFYVNAQHDPAKLALLSKAASSCPIEAPCCGTLPTAARCWHGRCFPKVEPAEPPEACLATAGATSDCTLCVCAEGSANAAECLLDPSCAPIFACAVNAECFGTLACDLAEPTFPCRAQVDATGGPTSGVAEKYRRSNARAAYLGCGARCSKP